MHDRPTLHSILLATALGLLPAACDFQQVEGEQRGASRSGLRAPDPARTVKNELAKEQGFDFLQNWTTKNSEIWTAQLAPLKGKPRLQMLEVGCFEGRSTIWFLDNILTHGTSRIACIDIFSVKRLEDRFDHNIEVSGHGARVTKIKDFSQRALRTLEPRSFDIIYIDGCHRSDCVFIDAAYSWELLKVGGVLIFDDYGGPLGRPKVVIDPFLVSFEPFIRVLHKDYQVILRKIRHAY
jgi:predicted O-methyltransferase YrrM